MMWNRRNREKRVAELLFGHQDLSREPNPGIRKEAERLRQVVEAIPRERPAPPGDVLPAVRARLRDEAAPRALFPRFRLASAAGAAVLLAAVLIFHYSDGGSQPVPASKVVSESPAELVLAEAEALLAQHDYSNAYELLHSARELYPDDPAAGRVQQRIGELHFAQFQRFEEAYAAYDQLRREHPEVYMANRDNIRRMDLLDEARRQDYRPLYELAQARTRRGDAFGEYEQFISRYPDLLIADVAVDEMVENMLADSSPAPRALAHGASRLEVLRRARERCSDPVAAGVISLHMAQAALAHRGDAEAAMVFGREAAQAPHAALAARARGFLEGVDDGPPR